MKWQSPCNCNAEPKRIENVIKTWVDGYGRERKTTEIHFVCGDCRTRGAFACEFNIGGKE
jgi:hypothetical protein